MLVHVEHLKRMTEDNLVNVAALARLMGMNRDTLHNRIKRGSNFSVDEMRQLGEILKDHGLRVHDE